MESAGRPRSPRRYGIRSIQARRGRERRAGSAEAQRFPQIECVKKKCEKPQTIMPFLNGYFNQI